MPQHNYFNAYDIGKSAVRLSRNEAPALPAGVHNFVGDRCEVLTKHFPLGALAPVVLHYVNCDYKAFRTKYKLLGQFPSVPDTSRVRMPFHVAARDLAARGDELALQRLYEIFVRCTGFGELPYLEYFGLLVCVDGVRDILDELWADVEKPAIRVLPACRTADERARMESRNDDSDNRCLPQFEIVD